MTHLLTYTSLWGFSAAVVPVMLNTASLCAALLQWPCRCCLSRHTLPRSGFDLRLLRQQHGLTSGLGHLL